MAPIDFEMAAAVHEHLRDKGVNLILVLFKFLLRNFEKSLAILFCKGVFKCL